MIDSKKSEQQSQMAAAYAPHEDNSRRVIRDERGREQPADKNRA
jgi:hypothetical protein